MVLNISNILNQSIHKAERVKLSPKRLIIDVDENETTSPMHQLSTSLSLQQRQLTGAIKRSREQLQTITSFRGGLSELRSNLSEMKTLLQNRGDSNSIVHDLKLLNSKMNQMAKTHQLVKSSEFTELNINSSSENDGDSV